MVTVPYHATVRGFEGLRGLRSGLAAWMADLGVDTATTDELLVAATELATNALEASPVEEAHLQAEARTAHLWIEVANDGPPFVRSLTKSTRHSDRGRGLEIVEAFTDAMTIDREEGCTRVAITRTY